MSCLFSSESVTEGHPDKVCDLIADAVLDAHLEQDPNSRVACEVLCKSGDVVLAGEINSRAEVDFSAVVRSSLAYVGYADPSSTFNCSGVRVTNLIGRQSERLSGGVDRFDKTLAAGDQGLVFGYATVETPELMPLPLVLAHRITRELSCQRKRNLAPFLKPDGKSQVTVRQENGRSVEVAAVVVSTQHAPEWDLEEVRRYVRREVLPSALGPWYHPSVSLMVNPAGPFDIGGPEADCGVTGRKIVVDTYGGSARHGGGAFSGKDGTKVDRSGAYFARFVARQIVLRGLAREAEIQIAYAIGVPSPVSIRVDTRGTGNDRLAESFVRRFDFRPASIIERLGLDRPIFTATTNYGHFGKGDLPWEK